MGKKVAIVGSGNWGSTIAKIVGNNVVNIPAFDKQVNMWVFEEIINGEKLSEVINTRHENIKYLPGVNLPTGVVAVTDVVETCKDADILVFVLPHQFLRRVCDSLKGKLKPNCYSISLIKGLDVADKGLHLISDVIKTSLGIPCHVLMGANLANEVAQEMFCEATIGAVNQDQGQELKSLMQTDYFRLVVSSDATCVELCGALKNIVALGAGFAEGMGYGENTKAAVIRLGLMEMKKFIRTMYAKDGIQEGTFFESCGIADLITTCYGGRNLKVSKAFVKSGKSMAELEKELLNGQSAQGILTAKEVYEVLTHTNQKAEYPMFVAIHQVCEGEVKPQDFINMLRSHPEHM